MNRIKTKPMSKCNNPIINETWPNGLPWDLKVMFGWKSPREHYWYCVCGENSEEGFLSFEAAENNVAFHLEHCDYEVK